MNTYVALLRGINVGGNNKIEMTRLKECIENVGFENVQTYINSGNVIFSSRELDMIRISKKIEDIITEHFDLAIPVLVKSQQHVKKVCSSVLNTLKNDSENKIDVMFLWDDYAHQGSKKLIKIVKGVDTVKYVDGSLIWMLEKENYAKSGISDLVGATLYKNMTVRNINTVRKIYSIMKETK